MDKSDKLAKHIRQGGFTLVELLLVVAILGILATVAIVNLTGATDDARVSTTRTSIAAIEQAVRVYEIRTGKFPDSIDQLMQPIGDREPLLDKKAKNDAWGNPFSFKKTSRFVEIRSAGKDGAMNTPDDILNVEE